MSKLTEKQKRFADEYIKSGNATESARLAGYSPKTANRIGSENLSKPDIKAYMSERLKELDSKRIMDAKEALELLTEIARGEMEEAVFMTSGLGVEEVTKKADINQRKDALKEILKRHPFAVDKEINELKREKLRLENLKLEQDVTPSETTENKLLDYFKALQEVYVDAVDN